MNKLAVLGTVLSLSFSSFAAEPWMSPKWTEQFCEYWNKNMQTVMAEWAEYNVNKQKGYKTIQFYREDCNPPKKVEVRIKYENGKRYVYMAVKLRTRIQSLLCMQQMKTGSL
jgi:hypothetical protein